MSDETDYADPNTIDVDTVLGNINHDFKMRGKSWTDRLSWPNVTVKALADEVVRVRAEAEESGTAAALATARQMALNATLQRIADGEASDPAALARQVLDALALHRVLPA